jgi:hypothetical protein
MDATSIVLLAGVCSFWIVAGLMASLLGKTRRVLESMEKTLEEVRSDLAQLTPVFSDTLREVEKTGQELGQTAAEVRLLARKVNTGSAVSALSAISGTAFYLPAALAVFKLVRPIFKKRKSA